MSNPTFPITRHPPFYQMPMCTDHEDRVRLCGESRFQQWLDDHEWRDWRGNVVARGYEKPEAL